MDLRTDSQGISVRAHYRQAKREINEPDLPFSIEYLWKIFLRMSKRRSGSGFGGNPLGWWDMVGFQVATGIPLRSWEIEALEKMDDLYLKTVNEEQDRKSKTKGKDKGKDK